MSGSSLGFRGEPTSGADDTMVFRIKGWWWLSASLTLTPLYYGLALVEWFRGANIMWNLLHFVGLSAAAHVSTVGLARVPKRHTFNPKKLTFTVDLDER